jgi:putative transposase
MRKPCSQLYLHCVWGTWDRLPLLTPALQRPVYSALLYEARELRCEPLAIGGMPDHVHLLVRLRTTVAVAQLLKQLKGASSHLVTHQLAPGQFFKWQGAYGAFTVSKTHVPEVKSYVDGQKCRHGENDLRLEWEQMVMPDGEG